MTLEEVLKLRKQQDDLCAFCDNTLANGLASERLSPTEVVLICTECFAEFHPVQDLFKPIKRPMTNRFSFATRR